MTIVAACGGSGGGNSTKGSGKADTNTDQTFTLSGTLPSDGPPEYGGTLRVNIASEPPSLDPHKSPSFAVPTATSGTVYNKLLEFESNATLPYGSMTVRPDLAESYEQSKDGLTWTFNLRKGVKFQNIAPVNGREFQASDVVCTFERIKTIPGAPQLYLLDPVKSWDTPNPYQIVFHMNYPYPTFDESVASFYMPIMPCEGTRGDFDPNEKPIGTGPFIMTKHTRNVEMVYEKNPNYFVQGQPYLDGLQVVVMADPNAAIAAMRTGQLDVTGSVTQTLLPSLAGTNPEIAVRAQLTLGPNQIMFNMDKAPFNDYRVRRAIAMSIDRETMANNYYSKYWAFSGPVPSVLFGGMDAQDAADSIPYDPEGAKKLLADAGFPNGFKATMLSTNGYSTQFTEMAQFVQEDLRKVGIDVTLNIPDYTTYFAAFQAKNYDFGWGLSSSLLSADEYLSGLYKSDGSRNYFNFKDTKLDQMIDEQRSELDKDKRGKLLLEIQKYILDEQLPLWFGFQFSSLVAQQPWVHNYYAHPSYGRVYMATLWVDSNSPTRK